MISRLYGLFLSFLVFLFVQPFYGDDEEPEAGAVVGTQDDEQTLKLSDQGRVVAKVLYSVLCLLIWCHLFLYC